MPERNNNTIKCDDRELATILASLRARYSDTTDSSVSLHIDDIATDGGKFQPLSAEEVDKLCERLNNA